MTAKTGKEILEEAKYFHRHLRAFYETLEHTVERPKLHLILEYLCRHESRMEEMLARYEDNIAEGVANTWFQYVPDISMDDFIGKAKIKPDMSLDDLMVIAIHAEDCFIDLYRHLAEESIPEEVREVFENLQKESRAERASLARTFLDMQDL